MQPQQPNQPTKQPYLNLIYNHNQWNSSIRPALEKMCQKVYDESELIKKLKDFSFYGQTHREFSFKKLFSFSSDFSYKFLVNQYGKELPAIFSNMAQIILEYEKDQPKFPILYAGTPKLHTYSKKQMLLLMSMITMNLIPTQNFQQTHQFPGSTNFQFIFTQQQCKTTSIIEYLKLQFKRLLVEGPKYNQQKLTLKRLVLNQDIASAVQEHKENKMKLPIIAQDKESIEEYFGDVKVDFANKYIGGGSFGGGCVQEQIMFINHPEMYTSALFCQVMKPNEAIQFIGYKKYWKNTGYAETTAFDGQEPHKYKYDEQNHAIERIVAIDALHYPSKFHKKQFSSQIINRELLKAYVGFLESGTPQTKIVTGNWGCGAFNGNIQLKFLIQWLASSIAGKTMIYVPFGSRSKVNNQKINTPLSKLTVGQVYKILMESQEQLQEKKKVFEFLQSKLGDLGLL